MLAHLPPALPVFRVLAVICWLFFPCAGPLQAHEVRPAIADLDLDGQGAYQIRIRLNLEALLAGIGTEHEDTDDAPQAEQYKALRTLEPQALQAAFADRADTFLQSLSLEVDGQPQALQRVGVDIPEVGDVRLARDSEIVLSGNLPAAAR
ncbi:MAG: hypothetical protein R3E89_16665, partial [Thiolinea sp.]